jgi:acyl-coenzyme A thioesterase PaaI-like protein
MPTIDLRVDYLSPAEFPITARATPKRIGKTIGIADVEILGRNGDASALGRAVFMTRAP